MLADKDGGHEDGGLMPGASPDSHVRSLTLALCVFTWAVVGLGVLLGASIEVDSAYHLGFMDPARVAVWWVGAALALSTLLNGRHRYWTVLTLMVGPAMKFTSYLGAWLVYTLPWGNGGNIDAWYYAIVQVPFMVVVIILALLLRPTDTSRAR